MKKRIKILFLILAVVFLSVFLSTFFLSRKVNEDKILAEIARLNPDEATIQVLKYAECKTLEKKENVWIVRDCNGDYYFKLFLAEDGYMLGKCTEWKTPREAFIKLRDFLPIKECVNVTAEDKLLRESNIARVYEVCSLKIAFVEECIVGVRL